jgi:hypothetical protein
MGKRGATVDAHQGSGQEKGRRRKAVSYSVMRA